MRSLAKLNFGKKYKNRLKPFNFLLSCHVGQFGHPLGVDPEQFHLVALYEVDPSRWLEMPWIDQYTGKQYQILTEGFHGSRFAARVKRTAMFCVNMRSIRGRRVPTPEASRVENRP